MRKHNGWIRAALGAALILSMMTALLPSLVAGTGPRMMGDVNDDESIDIDDILMLRNQMFGIIDLNGTDFTYADMNYDGIIDIDDILLVRSIIFGVIDRYTPRPQTTDATPVPTATAEPTPVTSPTYDIMVSISPPALPTEVCAGDIYYVSANNGNDDNDGTSLAKAWKTLQKAADFIEPGDTALVESGTYAGIYLSGAVNSGTANAWKCIKALDPANKPIINTRSAFCPSARPSNILMQGVSYWVLDGLIVKDSLRWGIDHTNNSKHIVVRNCEAYDNGTSGVFTGIFAANTDYYYVENCISKRNTEHGFYHNNSPSYFIYRGNISEDNGGCGYHLNGDIDFGIPGLDQFGMYERNLARHNGVTGGSGAALNMSGFHYGIVRNNVLVDNLGGGMTFYQINSGDTTRNIEVYNNLIVQAATSGRYAINFDREGGPPDSTRYPSYVNPFVGQPINLHFYNNIIASSAAGKRMVTTVRGRSPSGGSVNAASGVEFRNNIFETANAGSTFMGGEGASFDSALRSQWGTQNHFGISLDSLLVDYAGGDFRLKPGTVAVGGGLSIEGLSTDYTGATRTSWDIGPFAYVAP